MDWLSSFDPAAPKSSTHTATRGSSCNQSFSGSYASNRSQHHFRGTFLTSATVGPSTARSLTPVPRPPHLGQNIPYQSTSSTVPAGPTTLAYRPRPSVRPPPQRLRAAPPAAALRSEDAQPNENDTRIKPWEISAPPAIRASTSKVAARPSRAPIQTPRAHQSLNSAPRPRSRPPQRPQAQQPHQRPGGAPSAVYKASQKTKEQSVRVFSHPNMQWHPEPSSEQPPAKKPRMESVSSIPEPSVARTNHPKQTITALKASNETSKQPVTASVQSSAALISKQQSQSRSTGDKVEQSRQITIDNVYPEIRLWTRPSRTTAERLISNANFGDDSQTAIKWLQAELAPIMQEETQKALAYAKMRFKSLDKWDNSALWLALRNCPDLLLSLLQIRVEIYHCLAIILPVKKDRYKFAALLVRNFRDVMSKLLRFKLNEESMRIFCNVEQELRPTDPLLVDGLNQLHDLDDRGIYALSVLNNFIRLFGPRVLALTWSDVNQWKQQRNISESFHTQYVHPNNSDFAHAPDSDASSDMPMHAAKSIYPIKTQQVSASSSETMPTSQDTGLQSYDPAVTSQFNASSAQESLTAALEAPQPANLEDGRTPPPPCHSASFPTQSKQSPLAEDCQTRSSETVTPVATSSSQTFPGVSSELARPSNVASMVKRTLEPGPLQQDETAKAAQLSDQYQDQDRILKEAQEAEELARYPEQSADEEEVELPVLVKPKDSQTALEREARPKTDPESGLLPVKAEADDEIDELVDESRPSTTGKPVRRKHVNPNDMSVDDEDDAPLAALQRSVARTQRLDSADSDPDEDAPLQDLLQRQSSAGPTVKVGGSTWLSKPFEAKSPGLTQATAFSGVRGLSIKYFVPIASAALEAQTSVRNRAAIFDAAIAVSEHGRVATFSEQPCSVQDELSRTLPRKLMRIQSRDGDKRLKGGKANPPIDRVEDVSRLTSKVCGIVSSTKKLLGLANHDDYPCQVSLVTVDDTGRNHRTHHLDERPHAQGACSISHFPRTDPEDASSIDFATGGIDGIVNHWHWKAKSIRAKTFRLHTLHDSKPVVALEHLSFRSKTLASASIGTVIGYDLGALTLGFSWNTSDRIVHLRRTPDPTLMLSVLARRDYDQFRMFDISGRNGPISRPVICFGWLNDAEGKLPLGRGTFHPTRRAIFAHGAEDGHVRVWDMRNARDPLIDHRLGDEPIVNAFWASPEGGGGGKNDDTLYVATGKGVRSISLLSP
ncbi:uncharacterized protein MEPE_05473 [Melanopsichium pennsylvanicum]|uniref:Wd40 repeat-like protein n=2 Tax=Melanopsichium pennsylvanicum TaxID=63383 RepID=A0AAJ4XQS2_9BASI|nr:putative protein [Melanopsichium pennsylvanicum 4]SNX86764.1 uncharacterized protein MEPE_05473 [Melanopsichium pennsylvanicum]